MTLRALLAALLIVAPFALAGDPGTLPAFSPPTRPASATAAVGPSATIAFIPDTQNYCSETNVNPPVQHGNLNESLRQLDLLVADIIAMHPDVVIHLGDWTDHTGGADQDTLYRVGDDPNTFATDPDLYTAEWQCVIDHIITPILAAGIPLIDTFGNHDSCIDRERAYSAATFAGQSYFHAQLVNSTCGSGTSASLHRAALFTSPIGTLCAVSIPGVDADTDTAWANGVVGCTATRPTIVFRHTTIMPATMMIAANSEIFMEVWGHATPSGLQTSVVSAGTTTERVRIQSNWQEAYRAGGCTLPQTVSAMDGDAKGGVGFWTLVTVTPVANLIVVQGRSPVWGGNHVPQNANGTECTIDTGSPMQNASFSFSPSLCLRFPSLTGC